MGQRTTHDRVSLATLHSPWVAEEVTLLLSDLLV
jgi:hypothetical protein